MAGETQGIMTILGLPVTAYALCVVVAAAAGLLLLGRQCKKRGLKPGTATALGMGLLPLCLIGARGFYCLARISFYLEIGPEHILRLWEGGFALWGAVGGGALAAIFAARATKQPVASLLDALAAPAALTIALCRFAEYFSGEGVGLYVENEAFWRFPLAVRNAYGEWYWAVFMLEGAAALGILWALLKRKRGKPGNEARLFLILYSAAQVLLESLRRDGFLRWLFVRVSQLTAVLALTGLMIFAVIRWAKTPRNARLSPARVILRWAVFALCVGVCIALEFAIDKSPDLPIWTAYCIMAVCCGGMGTAAYQLVLKE